MAVVLSPGIPDALEVIVERLASAGLAASSTIGGVVIPGAWVHATEYDPLTNGNTHRLNVVVDLIANDHSEIQALTELDEMLGKALTVIRPSGMVETDNAIEFPSGALPAFRIPTTIEYRKE